MAPFSVSSIIGLCLQSRFSPCTGFSIQCSQLYRRVVFGRRRNKLRPRVYLLEELGWLMQGTVIPRQRTTVKVSIGQTIRLVPALQAFVLAKWISSTSESILITLLVKSSLDYSLGVPHSLLPYLTMPGSLQRFLDVVKCVQPCSAIPCLKLICLTLYSPS